MNKLKTILGMAILGLTLGLIFLRQSAYAACMYQGQSYPEGTVIEGRVCTNGKWR
jgi:hypothetical protein